MDMTESIAPKSDQMNAEDLLSGPRTFTITDVRVGSGPDQPVSVYLREFPPDRPFKPSKTVRRLLVVGWGPDSDAYIGKRLTLYRDPAVRFGGLDVGGIRVSHMSDLTRPINVALSVTRGRRAPYVVEPLTGTPSPPGGGPDRVARMLASFAAAGVTEGDIVAKLGRPREAWSGDDLDRMADVFRSLQAGEVTRDAVFGPPPVTVADLGPDPDAPPAPMPNGPETAPTRPQLAAAVADLLDRLRIADGDRAVVASAILGRKVTAAQLARPSLDDGAALRDALLTVTTLPDADRADRVDGLLVDGAAVLGAT